MPSRRLSPQAYKDITLGQLRSFTETARCGSLTGAASALQLAHPTVWKQVHALEQAFGTPLIAPYARGCRLTEAGTALLRLVAPSVFDLESLRSRFDEAVRNLDVRFTVAAPPRILEEDVVPLLPEFLRTRPRMQIALLDRTIGTIADAVESGEADFGLTTSPTMTNDLSLLDVSVLYELDVLLLAPRSHPLAKRRHVRPADLSRYGLLNSRQTLNDPVVHAAIERYGLFDAGPRRVETRQTSVLRRAVELGLGTALVIGRTRKPSTSTVHERVMSKHFGRSRVHAVRRRGVQPNSAVDEFASALRRAMTTGRLTRDAEQRSREQRSNDLAVDVG